MTPEDRATLEVALADVECAEQACQGVREVPATIWAALLRAVLGHGDDHRQGT
jgi:hypothetical protein